MRIWVTCLDEDNDPLPDGFQSEVPEAAPGLWAEYKLALAERVLESLGYTLQFHEDREKPSAWVEVNYIDMDLEERG